MSFTYDSPFAPPSIVKSPDAHLEYTLQWGSWLATGETIAAAVWSVSPADPGGLVLAGSSHTTKDATQWLSGGVLGEDYVVSCQVTTSAGRTDSRSFVVQIRLR